MNSIEIVEKQFDFLSPELPRPSTFIRRFQQGNNRFYYTVSEDGEVELYSSATTLIRDGYAEDTAALEKWRNVLRAEGKSPEQELNYLATRGTIMHFLLGEVIQGKELPIGNLTEYIVENAPEVASIYNFNEVVIKDYTWLIKSVLSFNQFVVDFSVKPLALELIMKSDVYKVASPIDLVCTMEIEEKGFFGEVYKTGEKKGQPKESKQKRTIVAVVDFKSNNFYDKHYLQLQLYKRILKENYPGLEIGGLFNWSPKDWLTSPTYNLKQQEDGKLDAVCECVFEQGRIKHQWKTPTVDFFSETVSIESYNSENVFKKVPLMDYLKEFHSKDGERSNS